MPEDIIINSNRNNIDTIMAPQNYSHKYDWENSKNVLSENLFNPSSESIHKSNKKSKKIIKTMLKKYK